MKYTQFQATIFTFLIFSYTSIVKTTKIWDHNCPHSHHLMKVSIFICPCYLLLLALFWNSILKLSFVNMDQKCKIALLEVDTHWKGSAFPNLDNIGISKMQWWSLQYLVVQKALSYPLLHDIVMTSLQGRQDSRKLTKSRSSRHPFSWLNQNTSPTWTEGQCEELQKHRAGWDHI